MQSQESLVPPNRGRFPDEITAALFFFQDCTRGVLGPKETILTLTIHTFLMGHYARTCPREQQPRRKAHLEDKGMKTEGPVKDVLRDLTKKVTSIISLQVFVLPRTAMSLFLHCATLVETRC